MIIITCISLVYINMQMKIIDLAYLGKAKEKIIRELNEENGQLTYQILSLKSSNHIGVKMLAEGTGMRFLDSNDIVHVQTSEDIFAKGVASAKNVADKRSNPVFSMLSQPMAR